MQVDPKQVTQQELHAAMLGGVGPRPIALASTIDADGRPNLSPFSFFNVFSSNPPMAIFSPARRGRDGSTKDTFNNVKAVPEVVIAATTYNMVQQVSLSSTEYETGVDEFVKSGLTKVPAERVKPYLVKEAPFQMECTVKDVIELGQEGGAGNLVLAEIQLIHIDDAILDADGKIDPHELDLVGRLGGAWYARASGDALFQVAKPGSRNNVGFDNLPGAIRSSSILTGNNLGQLGNAETMPDQSSVQSTRESDNFKEIADEADAHKRAKVLLDSNQVSAAWELLMAYHGE